MILKFKPVSQLSFMKKVSVISITAWAALSTILLLRLQPRVVLIGIDSYGARVITKETDRLLRLERENFIKKYLTYSYSYSSTNYDERTSLAGDMMASRLWNEKKKEFTQISENLRKIELVQESKILELREVDLENFEADLELKVRSKLQEATTKLRVEIKINKAKRTEESPYQYEVESYGEHVI